MPVAGWSLPLTPASSSRRVDQQSLDESDRLLSEGKNRLAVQEILWLLETISAAFQGSQHDDGTVTGKYFNKIVCDLSRLNKGRVLGEVTGRVEKLHGADVHRILTRRFHLNLTHPRFMVTAPLV